MNSVKQLVSKGVKQYSNEQYADSIKSYNQAKDIVKLYDPGNVDLVDIINRNIGLSYSSLMKYDKALESYNSVKNRNNATLLYETSLALLHLGRIDEAMPLYRNRYCREMKFPLIPLPFIEITSSPIELSGKNVLILNEEGLGDELMYMRSIYKISQIVESAMVQVYPELIKLFEENIKLPNIKFFSKRSFDRDFFDQCEVWTTTGTIWSWFPNEPALELKSGRDKLEMPEGHNIAFVHSPNIKSKNFKDRRINEQYFKNLGKQKGVVLHSMQYGTNEPYARNYVINDFIDTLQIIESVDDVQVIDTSVAHLLANSFARHSVKGMLVYKNYIDWRWTNNFYDIPILKV